MRWPLLTLGVLLLRHGGWVKGGLLLTGTKLDLGVWLWGSDWFRVGLEIGALLQLG